MQGLHYATAVSGKSLGTIAGLAFIFCKDQPVSSDAPLYLNLPYYMKKQIPFTLPHYFVEAVSDALKLYPERFDVLENRMEAIKNSRLDATATYPMIATWEHPKMDEILTICALNGFYYMVTARI